MKFIETCVNMGHLELDTFWNLHKSETRNSLELAKPAAWNLKLVETYRTSNFET